MIGGADEDLDGDPLLAAAMRGGEVVVVESLGEIRARSAAQLAAVPLRLRRPAPDEAGDPYPVRYSETPARGLPAGGEEGVQEGGGLLRQMLASTWGRWLSRTSPRMSRTLPAAPALGSERAVDDGAGPARGRSRPRTSRTARG